MLSVLRTAGWMGCVVYATIPLFWLMIHPRADYWRTRTGSPYGVLVPVWMGMWVGLGVATAPWRSRALYDVRVWSWIPAGLLFALGFWIYRQAGAHFSWAQLGGLPEVLPGHHEQRLMTTGIRARVRHPVYLAHLCEMLAWSVGTGLIVCYGLTTLAVISGAIMIHLEDRELEQRFGDQFRQYRRTTPAIWPRVF